MMQLGRGHAAASRRGCPRRSTIIATACLAFALAVPSAAFAAAPLIVVDAGHGGPYNHARYGRLREKNVNLSLALGVARRLQLAGYRVAVTRSSDTAVSLADISTWGYADDTGLWAFRMDGRRYGDPPLDDLQARVDIANNIGANLFVSIHSNGARSRGASGTETWASPRDLLGISLGKVVQKADVQYTRLRNRGAFRTDFYVLRWSNMPAVLVESAFLSNPREARLLGNSKFRAKLANGISVGIRRWFATNPYRPIQVRYTGVTPADVAIASSVANCPDGAAAVLLAPASDPAGAFAATALARSLRSPVLLADGSRLSTPTMNEIARLRPWSIVAIGDAASLPDSVVASAAAAAGLPLSSARRMAGSDDYETAALLATEVGVNASGTVVVVSDRSPLDLASAAAYSAATTAPVLLMPAGGALPPAVAAFMAAHSAEITRTIVVGGESAITSETAAPWPNKTRFSATDRFELNADLLEAAIAKGPSTSFVASPDSLAECLVALSAAAHTRGGAVLLNAGRVMSPYTRRWIVNGRAKSARYVIVGDYERQPVLVDWMIDKADR